VHPHNVAERRAAFLQGTCHCGSGLLSEELLDARGIYCGRVCALCRADAMARFRSEIFADPGYETNEPIEEEK